MVFYSENAFISKLAEHSFQPKTGVLFQATASFPRHQGGTVFNRISCLSGRECGERQDHGSGDRAKQQERPDHGDHTEDPATLLWHHRGAHERGSHLQGGPNRHRFQLRIHLVRDLHAGYTHIQFRAR